MKVYAILVDAKLHIAKAYFAIQGVILLRTHQLRDLSYAKDVGKIEYVRYKAWHFP